MQTDHSIWCHSLEQCYGTNYFTCCKLPVSDEVAECYSPN